MCGTQPSAFMESLMRLNCNLIKIWASALSRDAEILLENLKMILEYLVLQLLEQIYHIKRRDQ
jgi:hypothetical protein